MYFVTSSFYDFAHNGIFAFLIVGLFGGGFRQRNVNENGSGVQVESPLHFQLAPPPVQIGGGEEYMWDRESRTRG